MRKPCVGRVLKKSEAPEGPTKASWQWPRWPLLPVLDGSQDSGGNEHELTPRGGHWPLTSSFSGGTEQMQTQRRHLPAPLPGLLLPEAGQGDRSPHLHSDTFSSLLPKFSLSSYSNWDEVLVGSRQRPRKAAGPTRAEARTKGHSVWQEVRVRSAARVGSLLREQAWRSPCRREGARSVAVCT